MYEALFGNETAEKSLLYIVNYGEGHINGIASTFEISPGQVQRTLKKLEAGGILVSQFSGNARMFKINPRLVFKKELTVLLEKILMSLPKEVIKKYYRQRRRPRRTGKEL